MGKFTSLNTYIGKEEKSQVIDLSFHFKEVRKEEGIKSKQKQKNDKDQSRNKIVNKNKKISETINWFFEKIYEINKPITRLIRKKTEYKLPILGIREETRQ